METAELLLSSAKQVADARKCDVLEGVINWIKKTKIHVNCHYDYCHLCEKQAQLDKYYAYIKSMEENYESDFNYLKAFNIYTIPNLIDWFIFRLNYLHSTLYSDADEKTIKATLWCLGITNSIQCLRAEEIASLMQALFAEGYKVHIENNFHELKRKIKQAWNSYYESKQELDALKTLDVESCASMLETILERENKLDI